jgi:hypothetical protein
LRPTITIAIAPAAYGTALSRPTMKSLEPEAVLSICGRKKPMP